LLLLVPLGAWWWLNRDDSVSCVATDRPHAVMLVLDTSNSMALPVGKDAAEANEMEDRASRGDREAARRMQEMMRAPGRKRFDDARDAAIELMKELPSSAELGLVTFVGQCDVRVDVQPAAGDARERIIREVTAARPRSGTPLAASMRATGNELAAMPPRDGDQTIVILTDGREGCRGNPCAEAGALRQRLPRVTIHIIDVTGRSGLQCVADTTGGTIVTAQTMADLRRAIRKVQSKICK
jgi:hypothetical protein